MQSSPASPPLPPPLPPPSNSSGKIVWIVLGVSALAMFTCCGGCLMAFTVLGRSTTRIERVGDDEQSRPSIPPHMSREAVTKRQDEWLREQDEKTRKFFKLPE